MRDVRWIWILHQRPEILLLVVCGTLADCGDYENTAGHGARPICPFRDAVHLLDTAFPRAVALDTKGSTSTFLQQPAGEWRTKMSANRA